MLGVGDLCTVNTILVFVDVLISNLLISECRWDIPVPFRSVKNIITSVDNYTLRNGTEQNLEMAETLTVYSRNSRR